MYLKNNIKMELVDKCVGNVRINFGDWYAALNNLSNENPYEITYCKYCINNECVQKSDIYKINYEYEKNWNCNCDCPNKVEHEKENKCIKRFVCNKHKQKESEGMIMTCDMGNCLKCNSSTTSGALKYCVGCSASFQICEYCGYK